MPRLIKHVFQPTPCFYVFYSIMHKKTLVRIKGFYLLLDLPRGYYFPLHRWLARITNSKNPARDDLFVTVKPTPLPCPLTLPAWRAVFSIAPTYEKLVTNGYICHRVKIFPILRGFYMAYVYVCIHTYFTSLVNYKKWFNMILISL